MDWRHGVTYATEALRLSIPTRIDPKCEYDMRCERTPEASYEDAALHQRMCTLRTSRSLEQPSEYVAEGERYRRKCVVLWGPDCCDCVYIKARRKRLASLFLPPFFHSSSTASWISNIHKYHLPQNSDSSEPWLDQLFVSMCFDQSRNINLYMHIPLYCTFCRNIRFVLASDRDLVELQYLHKLNQLHDKSCVPTFKMLHWKPRRMLS